MEAAYTVEMSATLPTPKQHKHTKTELMSTVLLNIELLCDYFIFKSNPHKIT
jgi:hypothetical protein